MSWHNRAVWFVSNLFSVTIKYSMQPCYCQCVNYFWFHMYVHGPSNQSSLHTFFPNAYFIQLFIAISFNIMTNIIILLLFWWKVFVNRKRERERLKQQHGNTYKSVSAPSCEHRKTLKLTEPITVTLHIHFSVPFILKQSNAKHDWNNVLCW